MSEQPGESADLRERVARVLAIELTGLPPDTTVLPYRPGHIADGIAAHVVDARDLVPVWTMFLDAADASIAIIRMH
jgi:hypothetical protein